MLRRASKWRKYYKQAKKLDKPVEKRNIIQANISVTHNLQAVQETVPKTCL